MQLNYKHFGEGRPLIILHGLFGSARNWQGIARTLADTHLVITPDLRNHGQSPHIEGMSYPEMAADICNLIEQLKLNEPIVLGHSMGGKVAMTMALMNPDALAGLIVADIAPVTYDHDFKNLITAMHNLSLTGIQTRAEAESILSEQLESTNLIRFIMQNLVRTDEGFQWRINLRQITSSLPELGQFPSELKNHSTRLPALFVGGAQSSYIRSMHNPKIFHHFPAAEIKMIEDAGHWLHADKPNDFIEHVQSFIQFI